MPLKSTVHKYLFLESQTLKIKPGDEANILNQWDDKNLSSETAQDFSAGGVVFRPFVRDGHPIWQVAMMLRHDNKGWDLPKGHPEKKETPQEAAIREVWEEVGVLAKVVDTIGEARYMVDKKGRRLRKLVLWYLMEATPHDQKPMPHTDEAQEATWVDLDEAIPLSAFQMSQVLLTRAKELLAATPRHDDTK